MHGETLKFYSFLFSNKIYDLILSFLGILNFPFVEWTVTK